MTEQLLWVLDTNILISQVHACRDAKDDKFLDVALNGDAKAIITGDCGLLDLDPFHGIRIVNPAAFLTWA
ncbi:MAG: putative toxin-antitoxin system toxin component, PIN family [Candidatus Thiodiazotropha sp. (ex Dulcina madagascariensis)]|nr:putative toxin-antitoxin system toxin component, PIN family [Candidatus Thiodiazotropha sp. (ex Dulcina madagascariensis)]